MVSLCGEKTGKMYLDNGVYLKKQIVSLNFSGVVSITDFIKVWEQVFVEHQNTKSIKGYIINCNTASMKIDVDETEAISNFFHQNIDYFKFKRLAYITNCTEHIIIPWLLQEKAIGYELKPFSTLHAAKQWVSI